MKIDPSDAAALSAVLLRDIEAIREIERHIASLPSRELDRAHLDSLGFSLHNLYNALENSFAQISLTFENHVKDRSRWHRELLEKMFLEIVPLRPAVLAAEVRPLLTDMLGFRHLFRHSYELRLDESKLVALRDRWQEEGPKATAALERFRAVMAGAAGDTREDFSPP